MHITDMLLHPFMFSKFSYMVSHVLQLWRNEVSYKHMDMLMVMNESLFKAFKTFTCVRMFELSSIIMREIQLVRYIAVAVTWCLFQYLAKVVVYFLWPAGRRCNLAET